MPATIQRAQFTTQDVATGEDYIRQIYVDNRLRIDGPPAKFTFSSDLFMFGGVFLGGTLTTIAATIEAPDGADRVTIFSSRRPMRVGPSGQADAIAADEAVCLPLHIPYRSDWHTLESEIVSFEPAVLDDAAAAHLRPGQSLQFAFDRTISPVANQMWRRVSLFARKVAAANMANGDATLLTDELTRLLAGAALTCFGNTTMTSQDPSPLRTSPASLRRAVAYIDSRLDQPLQLTAIAEAARVSPRALNATFNRHHGTSVMAYVRQARMNRAHQDLKAAQPGDGESVTGIAARWGFSSLPRFGVAYRRAYGQPPSHTLREHG